MQKKTLSPVWNEVWRIKNVPATADLVITFMDKDNSSLTDDFIGNIKTSVAAGAKEAEIEGPLFKLRSSRGTFWLKVRSKFEHLKAFAAARNNLVLISSHI